MADCDPAPRLLALPHAFTTRLSLLPFAHWLARRFWVLLRWKEDGATLIFGHAPHFQHEIEEEEKAQGILYAAGKKGGKSGHWKLSTCRCNLLTGVGSKRDAVCLCEAQVV